MAGTAEAQRSRIYARGLWILFLGAGLALVGACRRAGPEQGELSKLGQRLLRSEEWVVEETDHAIIYGASRASCAAAARETEFAWDQVVKRLNVTPPHAKAHLFLIEDEAVWHDLLVDAGLRLDGLAGHVGNEIYMLRQADHPIEKLQIPHELVHFHLAHAFNQPIPLWLEEGLASYLAWEIAQAYHDDRDTTLTRTLPALTPAEEIPLAELVLIRDYPDDSSSTTAFYRESEELVRAIARTIGRAALGEFVRTSLQEQLVWQTTLRQHFGCMPEDLQAIEDLVRRRVGKETDDT